MVMEVGWMNDCSLETGVPGVLAGPKQRVAGAIYCRLSSCPC
jgi:hypothetical protein